MDMKDLKQSTYAQSLTADEIAIFNAIAEKEAIHNELGKFLSQYRESITETRNEFVVRLCQKYRIEKPSEVMYDQISQRLVSIYHTGVKAHKITMRPYAFTELAQALFLDAVKKLGEMLRQTKGNV